MYRQTRPRTQPRRARLKRPLIIVAAASIGLFVLINGGLYLAYANKTYPGTKVMNTTIGSVPYADLSATVDKLSLLPKSIPLTHAEKRADTKLSDLGVTKNTERAISSAKDQKAWLPILNLFKKPVLQAPVSINTAQLAKMQAQLAKTFSTEPVNAQLTMQGATVSIKDGATGYALDFPKLNAALLAALDTGKTEELAVPTVSKTPAISSAGLADKKAAVEKQLSTPITYKYGSQTKQPGKAEIASWYVQQGNDFIPDKEAILRNIMATGTAFGITVKDTALLSDTVYTALTKNGSPTISLTAATVKKTFTYCTNVKGVSTGELSILRDKLQATYHNSKGWSLNGEVAFTYGISGCDFTVWLAAAKLMPTFGAICDSIWSCRVGPNVVINYDRWQNASPAWNGFGGTLVDYRHMVINHETGHWLGFGHDYCGGAGQQAPVMQQQSINLQGCVFNPWPSAAELAVHRARLNL